VAHHLQANPANRIKSGLLFVFFALFAVRLLLVSTARTQRSWSSKAATKMKSVTTEFTEIHGKEQERDVPYYKVFLCDLCVLCGQHKQESDRIDHKEHIEKDDTCLLFGIQLIEIAF
jgi:hypothetical protein